MILTGVSFSASIGTVVIPNDVVQPSGLEATFTQGTIVGLGSAVATPGSLTLNASVGTLDPNDMTLGLTGVSGTFSVGSISPVDIYIKRINCSVCNIWVWGCRYFCLWRC